MNVRMMLFDIKGRLILFFTTVILSIVLFYSALFKSHYKDPKSKIVAITPAQYREWGQPAQITAGLYVTNFPAFDMLKKTYVLDCIVWFEFNVTVTSLERVSNFSFDKGTILVRELLDSKLIDEILYVRYGVRVEFTSALDYQYFPLDSHRIYLNMENELVSPKEMMFITYDSRLMLSSNIVTNNWRMVDFGTEYGFRESFMDAINLSKVDYTPIASFFFDFERSSLRKVSLIFIPLLIAFFLALGAFLIHIKSFQVLGLPITAITAMLGYRFVIDGMSPVVGYFMLSDYIFMVVLCCSFIIFLSSLVVFLTEEEYAWKDAFRSLVMLFVSFIFLLGLYYFLYVW